MTYERVESDGPQRSFKPGDRWVALSERSIAGAYFAILYWMNDEEPKLGPFPEPYDTGIGQYATELEAAEEAVMLADDVDVPCVLPKAIWEELKVRGLIK